MVNTEEFTKRLNQIMDYYDLTAAAFADQINVGRSSISHLLSGRNKPSLDFVMKIIQTFPEVGLYWLLNGKGQFPLSKQDSTPKKPMKEELPGSGAATQNLFSQEIPPMVKKDPETSISSQSRKEIEKIVIFYKDGSFEAYQN